ncbi:MAG: glycosyltransferase family 39 protein [Pseudomonadota bacterium]|nr:glycosyltransferase family 39 protein [Pseudomonadota bacterium]
MFLIVAFTVQLTSQYVFKPWQEPRFDAARYLNYAVNLYEHGVFGLSPPGDAAAPPPSRGNTPLYPAILAGVFHLGEPPPEQLRCYLRLGDGDCAYSFGGVRAAQALIAVTALAMIWFAGGVVTGGAAGAWTSALFAALSGQFSYYANTLLTENLSILLCALLTVCLCMAARSALRWYFLLGLSAGLLTLTRPEFVYLSYALVAVVLVLALRSALSWRLGVVAIFAVTIVVGPWLIRNRATFGDTALTESYAGYTLAQRVAYNRMSALEFGAALVYWFPDFGDTIARRLFPAEAFARLDFEPDSYASSGVDLYEQVADRIGPDGDVTRTLLVEEVLRHPVKHALASFALAWRGIFVAKLWGVAGLTAFVIVMLKRHSQWRLLALVSAPAWFMLALYAGVSVSLPRYSICFIPVFSLALGTLGARAVDAIRARRAAAT